MFCSHVNSIVVVVVAMRHTLREQIALIVFRFALCCEFLSAPPESMQQHF